MPEYGHEAVRHFLLRELQAEGLVEQVKDRWVHIGDRSDYEVTLSVRPIAKTIRLSED